jgi:RNA polymerase sigma factor (sigma-70 family)
LVRAVSRSAGQELTDAQLLERYVRRRDEGAFAALVRRHGPLVRSVCRHVLHHAQDADDAFQATFLVFASRAASIHKATAVASWLHGVAYRTAMNARRARKRRGEEPGECEARACDQPVPAAALREVQAVVDEELGRLPEKYRAPFVLCCLQGKSRAEAARELGWQEGTVCSRVAQARKLLQGRLTRRGVVLSAALTAAELSRSTATAVAPALARSTARAALAFATGEAVAGDQASAAVAALANGVLRGMVTSRLRVATAALLALGLAAAAGVAAHQGPAPAPPAAARAEGPKPAPREPEPAPDDGKIAVKLRASLEGHEGIVHAAAFAPDGKLLVTVSGATKQEGEVIVWDARTGEKKSRVVEPQGVRALAITPDGKLLATADYEDAAVRLRDPADGKVRAVLREHSTTVGTLVTAVAFTPDGKTLAAGYLDGTVELWDVAAGRVKKSFDAGPGGVYAVAVAPDGRALATAGQDGNAKLWDPTTARLIATLAGHKREVQDVAFSPDGRTLASASWDETVKLWETATGRERLTLRGHRSTVLGVAFSPDGRRLASAEGAWGEYGHADRVGRKPGEVRLWDLAAGREVATLAGHDDRVWGVAFAPDGKTLASACWDQKVRLWDLPAARPAPAPDGKEPQAWWDDLIADDAPQAYRAVWALTAMPERSVPFLAARLRAAGADAAKLPPLIRDLDDDDYDTREKASAALKRFGPAAEPALRKALEGKPSTEVVRRIEALLDMFRQPLTDPETTRAVRAVEVLEAVASPAAREALADLAKGAAGAHLTREAKASLARLAGRAARP